MQTRHGCNQGRQRGWQGSQEGGSGGQVGWEGHPPDGQGEVALVLATGPCQETPMDASALEQGLSVQSTKITVEPPGRPDRTVKRGPRVPPSPPRAPWPVHPHQGFSPYLTILGAPGRARARGGGWAASRGLLEVRSGAKAHTRLPASAQATSPPTPQVGSGAAWNCHCTGLGQPAGRRQEGARPTPGGNSLLILPKAEEWGGGGSGETVGWGRGPLPTGLPPEAGAWHCRSVTIEGLGVPGTWEASILLHAPESTRTPCHTPSCQSPPPPPPSHASSSSSSTGSFYAASLRHTKAAWDSVSCPSWDPLERQMPCSAVLCETWPVATHQSSCLQAGSGKNGLGHPVGKVPVPSLPGLKP